MRGYCIREADWERDWPHVRRVREEVFVREQGVPVELEWDEFDAVSRHVLAQVDSGETIGTARLLPDGHIGRMAVLPQWRGKGVGSAMLLYLIAAARRLEMAEVLLNAQMHALPFYRRHGFVSEGAPFMEAGIAHQAMRFELKP